MTTLNDMRSQGTRLYVNCSHPACCRSALVNLDMLIERLGGEHGAMHADLVDKFVCSACREDSTQPGGRDVRPVFFTFLPDYERDRQMRNARWERKGPPE